jgi:hypothetical protein
LPSPFTSTGEATAGFATSFSVFSTPSFVVFTGVVVTGSSTWPLAQSASTTADAWSASSFWPCFGSTALGVAPSNAIVPSTGSWSVVARMPSSAAVSFASSLDVANPTSREVKNEVTRVNGDSGWLPARSIVDDQSSVRPAAFGSISVSTSPAFALNGRLRRGSICWRSLASASPWLRPPTSTPATVTPRGTLPLEIRMSRPYRATSTPAAAPATMPILRRRFLRAAAAASGSPSPPCSTITGPWTAVVPSGGVVGL